MRSKTLLPHPVTLLIGFALFGHVALAQSGPTDAEALRKLTDQIYDDANANYDFSLSQGFATQGTVNCGEARARSLNKGPKQTTAAERYEAAVVFRQCVEERKAKLYKQNGADLTRLGGPIVATEYIQQVMKVSTEQADLAVKNAGDEAKFMGMTFGIGVGVSFASKAQVTAASVAPGNVVRVTNSQKQIPRAILEAHYYGVCQKRLDSCSNGTFGVGPFFGLAATGDAVDAIALGIMFGWKTSSPPGSGSGGFSVGLGAVLDKEFQQLAPGFEDGQPLPLGETSVELVKKSRWSPLLFFTKTF